ncbi:MAG TPA: hypothetical protein VGI57_02980, partial [Usitatibacter sp.]
MRARFVLRFLRRYRIALIALLVSALVHATVFVSLPNERADLQFGGDDDPSAGYSATLDTPAAPSVAPVPAARHAVKHVARARPKFQPIAVPDEIAPMVADPFAQQM